VPKTFDAKTFEFAESFSKPVDGPWPAFTSGGRCETGFPKDNSSSETYLVGLTIGMFGLGRYSKDLSAIISNFVSISSQDINGISNEFIKSVSKSLSIYFKN
jgi:hypothetical protein